MVVLGVRPQDRSCDPSRSVRVLPCARVGRRRIELGVLLPASLAYPSIYAAAADRFLIHVKRTSRHGELDYFVRHVQCYNN